MTNQPNPPAAFAPTDAADATDDQTFVRVPEAPLPALDDVVAVVDLPPGTWAPVVVTQSVESALALAAARILPGPARIVAALTLEALAALRLPEVHGEGALAPQHPRRVVFAPDGTPESLQAARRAARRARAAGWTVDGLPAPEGFRWTDVEAGRVSPPQDHLARIADLWVPWPDADRCEDPCGGLDETRREPATGLSPDH